MRNETPDDPVKALTWRSMSRREAAMNTLKKNGAEAWPISREDFAYRPILEQVIIESNHPDGRGVIRLSPDQALYTISRLSLISMAFL
jgi:hypothetical protein